MNEHNGTSDAGASALPEGSAENSTGVLPRAIQFFAQKPLPADIVRYLTLSIGWPETAIATTLISADGSGAINRLASFGPYQPIDDTDEPVSLFSDHAVARALLRAEPRLYSTHEISTPDPSALPLFDARIGIEWMVARMQSHAGLLGALCMTFRESVAVTSRSTRLLNQLADLCGMYLSVSQQLFGSSSSVPGQSENTDQAAVDLSAWGREKGLSTRQLQVFRMQASGMTYAQIARALDYSQSTVRSDLIDFYRQTGTVNRHGARDLARELGITTGTNN